MKKFITAITLSLIGLSSIATIQIDQETFSLSSEGNVSHNVLTLKGDVWGFYYGIRRDQIKTEADLKEAVFSDAISACQSVNGTIPVHLVAGDITIKKEVTYGDGGVSALNYTIVGGLLNRNLRYEALVPCYIE